MNDHTTETKKPELSAEEREALIQVLNLYRHLEAARKDMVALRSEFTEANKALSRVAIENWPQDKMYDLPETMSVSFQGAIYQITRDVEGDSASGWGAILSLEELPEIIPLEPQTLNP